jgi:hypothetical protein
MATQTGAAKRGKLGNKIYYVWHGRQCERSMPVTVSNPRTEAQQANRRAFVEVTRLSSYMKEAHTLGLHSQALREQTSTYGVFRRLNKGCLTEEGEVDYGRVTVSRGPVTGVNITSAKVVGNVLTVKFNGCLLGGDATDEFFLFVYSPRCCEGGLAAPVGRLAGEVQAELSEEWLQGPKGRKGAVLHLYAFLRSAKGRTSDSVHRALTL